MPSFGMHGSVESIFTSAYSGEPMESLDQVQAIAGCGLEGDRYVRDTGYWSGVDECQVTLIEGEILVRIWEDTGLSLFNGEHRRNIVTRGIRLQQLLGKCVIIGQAAFEYECPRPPCEHLQAVTAPGTARALFGQRGGIGVKVIRSGLIQVGDDIVVQPGPVLPAPSMVTRT